MAMLTCPSCGKTGDLPDSIDVGRVRCRECGYKFTSVQETPLRSMPTLPGVARKELVNRSEARAFVEKMNPLAMPRESFPTVARVVSVVKTAVKSVVPSVVTLEQVPAVTQGLPPVKARVETPALLYPSTKTCLYCGEAVLISALKCKHCGEFIDPAMRAAEEAKRFAMMASRSAMSTPAIVNVNQAVSAVAGMPVVLERRRRVFSRLVWAGVIMIVTGLSVGMSVEGGHAGMGSLLFVLGVLIFVLGLIVTVIRWFLSLF